jgi:threonine dehydratase
MSGLAARDALPVSSNDVRLAARLIDGRVVRTPASVSGTLSDIVGATVAVKFENLQFTASYKERGALNRLLALDPKQRQEGVVAVSAGNFAQAVAYHAGVEKIPATIVMPAHTPSIKATRTESLGAHVLLAGDSLDEAEDVARAMAEEKGLAFLSPYDDAHVIAGQGTVGLEFLKDFPDLDALIIPVGGGGLLAGVAIAARAQRPDIELVGVQVDSHAAMVAALRGERPSCRGNTIAEGIAVKRPGALPLQIIGALCQDVITVPEARLEEAVCLFLEVEKVVAEGAGAAGLAALLQYPDRFAGKRVGLVLTGGNIDLRLLASVIMSGLVRTGRLATFRIEIPDEPGALGKLTATVGRHGGNIVELSHRRTVLAMPSKAVTVEVAVETRGRADLEALVDALCVEGYAAAAVDEGYGESMSVQRVG